MILYTVLSAQSAPSSIRGLRATKQARRHKCAGGGSQGARDGRRRRGAPTLRSVPRYLVDGMNVIGSRPDGWWRDRGGAMRRLVADLERFAAAHPDDEVVVVL